MVGDEPRPEIYKPLNVMLSANAAVNIKTDICFEEGDSTN